MTSDILCHMVEKTTVSSTTRIAASPETVYAMVSDLTRMGEWSPEAKGGEWMGGASGPAVGVKFKGRNASGTRKWTAISTVTDVTAPRRFAFVSGIGPLKVSEWCYEITPVDGGAACDVTETWLLHQPLLVKAIGKFATGVADRAAHTKVMIDTTLARLKESAESGG